MPTYTSRTHADSGIGASGGAPLWGHEALDWVSENARLGFRDACGRGHWGLRWGLPIGATKRCNGCAGRMRTVALGSSVGLPMGPRSA
eukprot:188107-Pyramimonas_sp.AAC.1